MDQMVVPTSDQVARIRAGRTRKTVLYVTHLLLIRYRDKQVNNKNERKAKNE